MNRLFIRLYLDEDVDVLVAALLKGYGFEAVTTREAGRLGSEDEEQLAHAVRKGMAVLTHNRVHFEGPGGRLRRGGPGAPGHPHRGAASAVRDGPAGGASPQPGHSRRNEESGALCLIAERAMMR